MHHLSWLLSSKPWQQQVGYSPLISLGHQEPVGIEPTLWTWQTCFCWEPFPDKISYLLIKKKSFFYNWSKNESCWSFPTFCGGSRIDRVHSAHSACLFRAGAQENTFNFVVGLTVQVKETSGFQRLPKISLYVNSLQLFIHLLVDICLSLQFPNWFCLLPKPTQERAGMLKGIRQMCAILLFLCNGRRENDM